MIKLKFGEPRHDWLPVKIEFGNCSYEFEASYVPVDPVAALIGALSAVLGSIEGEVWWHLEPDGYYLNIVPINEAYQITLSHADGSKMKNRKRLYIHSGSFSEVLLPIWRSLREFYSHKYTEPHWPDEPVAKMQSLTNKIREIRGQ